MTVYLVASILFVCISVVQSLLRRVCPVSGENSLDSVCNRREQPWGGGGCS